MGNRDSELTILFFLFLGYVLFPVFGFIFTVAMNDNQTLIILYLIWLLLVLFIMVKIADKESKLLVSVVVTLVFSIVYGNISNSNNYSKDNWVLIVCFFCTLLPLSKFGNMIAELLENNQSQSNITEQDNRVIALISLLEMCGENASMTRNYKNMKKVCMRKKLIVAYEEAQRLEQEHVDSGPQK